MAAAPCIDSCRPERAFVLCKPLILPHDEQVAVECIWWLLLRAPLALLALFTAARLLLPISLPWPWASSTLRHPQLRRLYRKAFDYAGRSVVSRKDGCGL